jgi:cytosine deaminase
MDEYMTAADYRKAVLYSTLSPCDMCSGAILLYGIPRVVVGENRTFQGPRIYSAIGASIAQIK